MSKHIGIVASSSEGASLCYRTICLEASSIMGEHNHPEITMSSVPLATHLKFIHTSDWAGLAQSMAYSADKLAAAGADFVICPDNTNHLAFNELAQFTSVPFIHIAEAVVLEAARKNYKNIGILGTKFLMEGTVYPEYINRKNLKGNIPEAADREIVNDIIFEELCKGIVKEASKLELIKIINKLKDKNCDAVILGCTELPLILDSECSPLPTLDSTRLLARAALKEAMGE